MIKELTFEKFVKMNDISDQARMTYLVLVLLDREGVLSEQSITSLAEIMGIVRYTANKRIIELEKAGFLRKQSHGRLGTTFQICECSWVLATKNASI